MRTITAERAAELLQDGMSLGVSGFTGAGRIKVTHQAIAQRGVSLGHKYKWLTGASCGDCFERTILPVCSYRAPFQSAACMREAINKGHIEYADMHLSQMAQLIEAGRMPIDVAIIEASDITPDGRVYLTTSIGNSPVYLRHAKHVIIELNHAQPKGLCRLHDVLAQRVAPPATLHHYMDRVGMGYARVDMDRVVGIVETNEPDNLPGFKGADETSARIAGHVLELVQANKLGGYPFQSGVGATANAVLGVLGEQLTEPFGMYSEVFQDSAAELMLAGKISAVSTAALTLSGEMMQRVFDNLDFFAERVVIRPQYVSNDAALIRQFGVVAMNTFLEVGLYGDVNSTHVNGTYIMNGIGGSGEFTRNAGVSLLLGPASAKGGRLSTVVPMCSHVDHSSHSVGAIGTEFGMVDIRGLSPNRCAEAMIDIAHPDYRGILREYLAGARGGHIAHNLDECFRLHRNFLASGDMRVA